MRLGRAVEEPRAIDHRSAPEAAERALSLGQPSRGRTSRRSVRPQFSMARAAVPMFSPSCGSTRMIAGPPDGACCLRSVPGHQRAWAEASAPARNSFQVMASCSALKEASMMLVETPTVVQRSPAVGALDHHPGHRLGAGLGVRMRTL